MRPTKADILLIISVLTVALLIGVVLPLVLPRGHVAVITQNGVEMARLPLDTDCQLDISDGYRVVISDGSIRMDTASCPDLICVHTPPACRAGETIVCLPGKIVITVEVE